MLLVKNLARLALPDAPGVFIPPSRLTCPPPFGRSAGQPAAQDNPGPAATCPSPDKNDPTSSGRIHQRHPYVCLAPMRLSVPVSCRQSRFPIYLLGFADALPCVPILSVGMAFVKR